MFKRKINALAFMDSRLWISLRGMCNCGKRSVPAPPSQAPPTQMSAHQVAHVLDRTVHTRKSILSPLLQRQRVNRGQVPISPTLWGPHMWTAIHTLSLSVSFASARAEWLELLTPLAASLPCPECAKHYSEWLASHPLAPPRRTGAGPMMRRAASTKPLSTPVDDIAAWLLDLHNAVNGRKGVASWNMDSIKTTYVGGSDAVRASIESVRGMIGARAISGLETLLGRM